MAVEFNQNISFTGLAKEIAGLEGATEIADPIYPYAQLMAQETGEAKVRFFSGPTAGW